VHSHRTLRIALDELFDSFAKTSLIAISSDYTLVTCSFNFIDTLLTCLPVQPWSEQAETSWLNKEKQGETSRSKSRTSEDDWKQVKNQLKKRITIVYLCNDRIR
jgi:hypothetical protein